MAVVMKTNSEMEYKLSQCRDKGLIVSRTENNPYLKVSYKGTGKLVSDKWNIKIYTSGSVVCNDIGQLNDLLNDKVKPPDDSLKLLEIDDAGWGFPLSGVIVAVSDGTRIESDIVDVSFFRGSFFDKKYYLNEYSKKGLELVEEIFGATSKTHRIHICTGYINTYLKDVLRKKGYDTRVIEIKGLLQDELENIFKRHIRDLVGRDIAYDPKEIGKDISNRYYQVVNWARINCPHLLKNGWKSLQNI